MLHSSLFSKISAHSSCVPCRVGHSPVYDGRSHHDPLEVDMASADRQLHSSVKSYSHMMRAVPLGDGALRIAVVRRLFPLSDDDSRPALMMT